MARIRVGRDRSCHVVLADRTVSRLHGYLVLGDDGSSRFEDAGSTGGSYLVDAEGEFFDLDDVDLGADDTLMLGALEISVGELLDLAEETATADAPRSVQGGNDERITDVSRTARVRRDPLTGKIVHDEEESTQ